MQKRIPETSRRAEPQGGVPLEAGQGFLTIHDLAPLGGWRISPKRFFRMGLSVISQLMSRCDYGLDQIRTDCCAFSYQKKERLGTVRGKQSEQRKGIIAGAIIDGQA